MTVNLSQYRNSAGDLLLDLYTPLERQVKLVGEAGDGAYRVWLLSDEAFAREKARTYDQATPLRSTMVTQSEEPPVTLLELGGAAEEKKPWRLTFIPCAEAVKCGFKTLVLRLPELEARNDELYFDFATPFSAPMVPFGIAPKRQS